MSLATFSSLSLLRLGNHARVFKVVEHTRTLYPVVDTSSCDLCVHMTVLGTWYLLTQSKLEMISDLLQKHVFRYLWKEGNLF